MQMVQTAGAIGGIAASLVRVPTEVCNYYNFYAICAMLCSNWVLLHSGGETKNANWPIQEST